MSLFLCPICGAPLTRETAAYRCKNGHSYDIAKEGHTHLLSRLEELRPGQTLEVWQHPNSHTVLALSADGEEILNYQRAQSALRKGNIGCLILGIFLYLTAALAAFGLFVTIRHRKSLPYRTSPRHHPAIHRH